MPSVAWQSRDGALGCARSGRRWGTEADQQRAFREAYLLLENRIKLFVTLPIEKLDRMAIKRSVDQIGHCAASRLELS